MPIESAELVTEVYGYWPLFEGAYVLSAKIESDSTLFYELGDRTFTIELHWWLEAPDHYPGGPIVYEPIDLHRRIQIAFCVEDLHIHTFHCSNPQVDQLSIHQSSGQIKCEGGFEMSFSYNEAKVLAVDPCDECGRTS